MSCKVLFLVTTEFGVCLASVVRNARVGSHGSGFLGWAPMVHSALLVLRLSSVWIAKNFYDLSSPDATFLFVCTRRVGLVRVVYRSSHHPQHGACKPLIFKENKLCGKWLSACHR
jgi:hypothetical protein